MTNADYLSEVLNVHVRQGSPKTHSAISESVDDKWRFRGLIGQITLTVLSLHTMRQHIEKISMSQVTVWRFYKIPGAHHGGLSTLETERISYQNQRSWLLL